MAAESEFVDLDLDLMVAPDGAAHERDHDTFARHRDAMKYSEDAVDAAYAGIDLARRLLGEGVTPFDGSPARTLGRVIASAGPL